MEDKKQSIFKQQRNGFYGSIKKAITFRNVQFKESSLSAPRIEVPKVSKSKVKFSEQGPSGMKNEHVGNDRFSDYIKRARMKIRSMTMVGGGGGGGNGRKSSSRLESINKKTSAYIDQAKVKMRTASIVGFRKKTN